MSSDARPLHDAILAADPRDDLEPLVFADWLEDQGRASQAEFLRIQRRLMSLPQDDPEGLKLKRRRAELFRLVRTWYDFPEAWYDSDRMPEFGLRHEYPEWLQRTVLSPRQYCLGFVSYAEIHYRSFLDLVHPLMRYQPVMHLNLRLDCSYLPRADHRPASLDEFARLAESPHLVHVTEITAMNVHLAGLEILLRSPYLSRLRELRAFSPPKRAFSPAKHVASIPLEVVEALTTSPARFELEVLDLYGLADPGGEPDNSLEPGNPNANRAAELIGDSPRMKRLKKLRIFPGLGPSGAMALRTSKNLESVEDFHSAETDWLSPGPVRQAYHELVEGLRDRCG